MNTASVAYKVLVGLMAFGFGVIHHWHVSTLFENDRHFSHLSEIEREMSFRTEMGMYYHYYKTIVEAPSWREGLSRIRNDSLSQHPNVINADKTYNLFPEIFSGILYHNFKSLGLLGVPECWETIRGEGLSTIQSCQGLAVPSYFYLEIVWCFSMLTGITIFLYATYLSGSIYGGIIAILSFFSNHTECTRVQWTPPLRESFAYPILLFQMYRVTMVLDKYKSKKKFSWKNIFLICPYLDIVIATEVCLYSWQFSQFVMTTQVIALLILQWTKIIPRDLTLQITLLHSIAILLSVLQGLLDFSSLYFCLVISSIHSNLMNSRMEGFLSPKMLLVSDIIRTFGSTHLLQSAIINSEDYNHVFDILKSKLSNYRDFHTMLYTCSPEFDFLQYETFENIVQTLLLPIAICAGFLIVYYWYRNYEDIGYPECIEAGVAYVALQTGAFIIMALLIMRLKLFMTPHLCIIAGMVMSGRYLGRLGSKYKNAIFIALVCGISYHGVQRIQEERQFYGEYSNIEQEQLFEWIKSNTPKSAVFAGKMSVMANLLLSTGRPIVNNPYYESEEMRDRTLRVYEIYSRKEPAAVYETLRKMEVDYLVIEEGLCYGLGSARPGCKMVDLWDVNDGGQTKRLGKRPLCPILYGGNCHPFKRVFANNRYVVLRLDYSTYVELKPSSPILMQS